jgi:hypothetical protein
MNDRYSSHHPRSARDWEPHRHDRDRQEREDWREPRRDWPGETREGQGQRYEGYPEAPGSGYGSPSSGGQDWEQRREGERSPWERSDQGSRFGQRGGNDTRRDRERGMGESPERYGDPGGYAYPGGQWGQAGNRYGQGGWAGQSSAGMYGETSPGGFGYGRDSGNAWRRREGPRRFNQGPKGYSRSDERIKEDVSEHLMGEEGIDPSEVTVQVSNGVVVLEGTVPERYMKHVIEDIVDGCMGVKDVQNQLRVSRRGSLAGAESTQGYGSSTSDRSAGAGVSGTDRSGKGTGTAR